MTFQLKSLVLPFIVICLLTVSCNKEAPTTRGSDAFPAKLNFQSVTFNGEVKVYTKNGEVTNPTIKSQAIISTGMDLIIHRDNFPADTAKYVTFSSENFFVMANDWFDLEKLNNTFIFKYVDSNVIRIEDHLLTTVAPFYKYPPVKKNSDGTFTYRRQFVGHGDYSSLAISSMDLCILRRDTLSGAIIERRVGYDLNEFNPEGIKSLGKYDTLSVRELRYHYRAKR